MDTTSAGIEIYDRWAQLWSGTLPARAIMASSIRLRYAQPGAEHFNEITDVDSFAGAVGAFRAARPGILYEAEGPGVVDFDDEGTGHVARPYLATIPDPDGGAPVRVSGTDILRCECGRIVEVWSVSARGLPFYPEGASPVV
ncbi:hypothetical protein [Microbacterium sp. NPDC057650]|uniref:hypothetical protein n=1 Tax=unclassified Microbacterium TaxID=2609290 RepID=UPI00366F6644